MVVVAGFDPSLEFGIKKSRPTPAQLKNSWKSWVVGVQRINCLFGGGERLRGLRDAGDESFDIHFCLDLTNRGRVGRVS